MAGDRGPVFRTTWGHAVGKADLKPTTKLIAYAIGVHMSVEGRAELGRARIGSYAGGVGITAVKRHIARLEEAGLIVVVRGVGKGNVNTYRGQIPAHLLMLIEGERGGQKGSPQTPFSPQKGSVGIAKGVSGDRKRGLGRPPK